MSERAPFSAYSHTATYSYRQPDGSLLFEKRRYEILQPISGERSKRFLYFDRVGRRAKPPGADSLLYRVPELLLRIPKGETVHFSEGEKDADALRKCGALATSHHQGAGNATLDQMAWLRGARRIVLWVDRDIPGFYDAFVRHNLLVDVGVAAWRIKFVRAQTGKDAFDHIKAGHDLTNWVALDKQFVADKGARHRHSSFKRWGY